MTTAFERLIHSQGKSGNKFLGFDIGIRNNLGWAILNSDGSLHQSGVWNLGTSEESVESRLERLTDYCIDLFWIYGLEIAAVGIERPWVGKNPQTALTLGWVAGTIFGIACTYGKQTFRIQPMEAKKAFTDNGKAPKSQVLKMAQLLKSDITSEDEADAIAVATATRLRMIKEITK